MVFDEFVGSVCELCFFEMEEYFKVYNVCSKEGQEDDIYVLE